MFDQQTADMWRSILDRCAEGLDLTADLARWNFRYAAQDALRDVDVAVLADIAASLGSTATPLTREWTLDSIVSNYLASVTGRGTDRDIDAGTHCPLCRAPYRREPARAENLWIPRNVCTRDECGYYDAVRGPDGLPVIEKPVTVVVDESSTVTGRYRWTPSWPESWHERLARRIAPAGWYRGKAAPTIPAAIVDRIRLEGSELPELPGYIAEWARLDVAPVLRRTGWKVFYRATRRAARGAARVSRRASQLHEALYEIAVWASYGVDDREGKDGQL